MNVPLLDLVAQHRTIADEVTAAALGVINGQQFIMGPEVAELEAAIAKYSGAAHAVACASGTDALLLALRTLDLQPGDEVICPSFTFFATAGAVHNAGGVPVFVDIDPQTFNLDASHVAAAVTPNTRAVIAVHLYGQMAALEQLAPICTRHGLVLIEDAAQAIGATRLIADERRSAGTVGRLGTLSFFPSKNLGGWGDAGMILTDDVASAERLARLRLHGGAKQYHHDEVGYNSRLDTLQAAVLLVKLRHLDAWSAARRSRASRYDAALRGVAEVVTPFVDEANVPIFHQYTIRADRRDALAAHLHDRGIGCAVYYPKALHLQPCFAGLGYRAGSLPETERAADEVLSLPVFPELTDAQQDTVVSAIRDFYL